MILYNLINNINYNIINKFIKIKILIYLFIIAIFAIAKFSTFQPSTKTTTRIF